MSTSEPVAPRIRFRHALASVRPEIERIPDGELVQINLDIPTAVMTAIQQLPRLRELRSRVCELPRFDVETFDKLEEYALALGQAHAQYQATFAPPKLRRDLYFALRERRALLVSDVRALVSRKVIDGASLKQLKGPPGHKNVAFDVMLLCALLRKHWAVVENRTAISFQEVQELEALAQRLTVVAAERKHVDRVVGAAARLRTQAFTRFVSAYDHARRAVIFLRWVEGDAEAILPSLYVKRGKKRRRAAPEKPGAVARDIPPTQRAGSIPGTVDAQLAGRAREVRVEPAPPDELDPFY